MKRVSTSAKIQKKRQLWIERSSAILGMSQSDVCVLLSQERQQSVRYNPLRSNSDVSSNEYKMVERSGDWPHWVGEQCSWMGNGYSLKAPVSEIRDETQITEGVFFIQNAASWLPVLALDPVPGEKILDVCAAPGGKTSHIAAITENQAEIWANDNSRPRLAKLQANMRRLGVQVSRYTLFDATRLNHKLESDAFDKILLDAPCSGEGLMNLSRDKDLATWSVAHIKRLQQLQKRILITAWQLLKPGGTLVYSTCTMAPEENEAVIYYLLRSRSDARIEPFTVEIPNKMHPLTEWNGKTFSPALQGALRVSPSPQIEAFFVCKLTKVATPE